MDIDRHKQAIDLLKKAVGNLQCTIEDLEADLEDSEGTETAHTCHSDEARHLILKANELINGVHDD